MTEVPDLRMFGVRLVQCACALVLGFLCALAIALNLPTGSGREASAFAPLSLIVAMGGGLSIAWFALFDSMRRHTMTATVIVPSNLPVARVLQARHRGELNPARCQRESGATHGGAVHNR